MANQGMRQGHWVLPDKAECDALRAEFGPDALEAYLNIRNALFKVYGMAELEQFDKITDRLHTIRYGVNSSPQGGQS